MRKFIFEMHTLVNGRAVMAQIIFYADNRTEAVELAAAFGEEHGLLLVMP